MPEFILDDETHVAHVNLVDPLSGRVVRCLQPEDLDEVFAEYSRKTLNIDQASEDDSICGS